MRVVEIASRMMRVAADGRTLVRDIRNTPVFSCREEEDVSVAEKLMRDLGVDSLPVVDSAGTIVGYVNLSAVSRQDRENSSRRFLRDRSLPIQVEPRGRGSIFDCGLGISKCAERAG
jgi:predicted transcriptional regulator